MKTLRLLICVVLLGVLTLSVVSCNTADKAQIEEEVSHDEKTPEQTEEKVYTLIYNTNGGEPIPPQQVKYGDTFDLVEPVREGYEFQGWYLGPAVFSAGVWEYTVNLTIDAKWSENP